MLAMVKHCDPSRISWRGVSVYGTVNADVRSRFEGQGISVRVGGGNALARDCDLLIGWGRLEFAAITAGSSAKVLSISHITPDWDTDAAKLYGDTTGIDHFVAVSELAAETIPAHLRPGTKIIWNCVDPERIKATVPRSEVRARWGIPDGKLVAGFLGRLTPEKDPLAMIRAARVAPPHWHFVVVGEGWDSAKVTREAEGLANVTIAGPEPSPGNSLAAFDFLVVPSRFESFGLSLCEGLALAVPVISTRVGVARIAPGMTQTIPFGASGFHVVVALESAREGSMTAARREERGLQFARERLSAERFGREWTDHLLSLFPPKANPHAIDPAIRDAVLVCPDRGNVLPISMQAECGCLGQELTECRSGRGKVPGRVTLRECLKCRSADQEIPGP